MKVTSPRVVLLRAYFFFWRAFQNCRSRTAALPHVGSKTGLVANLFCTPAVRARLCAGRNASVQLRRAPQK
ncbi:hypothetical protein NDU88_009687 [Pleurodeles waltl]|uniref:Secreted protein n=1 Tax=Pleurodeles waltl TaxID=8319 RepID=A0AAV7QTI1_PLEWA|nr:hypothetical protein NDU88_009687 [Pleurodeles waltl]